MFKTVWSWTSEVVRDFLADGALAQSAAISFYALFSLAPLLLVVIAVAGMVWGAEAARGEIVGQFSGLVGEDGGRAIEQIVQKADRQGTGALATTLGILTLVFGASGAFGQLKAALNRIWEVQAKPGNAIVSWLRERFTSMAMVMCIGFLLVVSLAISAGLAAAGDWLRALLPLPAWLMQAINFIVSLLVLALLFAAMYKVLPDVKIPWRNVWMGAAVTAALFTLGKFLIGFYLGRASVASVYGAAGSVVLILLWVYYSSLIFLVGAEFTQVYASRSGAPIEPNRFAIPLAEAQAQDKATRPPKAVEQTQQARGKAPRQLDKQRSRTAQR